MEDKELIRVVDFIEGYYSRKLDSNEIKAIKFEKVEYFTVAQLHKIIEEYKETQKFKESLGVNSFDELYEN